MAGSGQAGDGDALANIRTDVPHPARVYDYWLGGKDNFAADRAAAEQVLQVMPEILDTVRGNRQFLVRAVGFLRDAGIRQFLDIGSGLPSSPNVHEVAQAGGTGARVVYSDHDEVVVSHADALMAKNRNDTALVVHADLRDVDKIISRAGELLDFTKPVGLIFAGVLHHIPDSDDPAGIVARYLAALAPGSYLAISHATAERSPEKMAANADVADSSGTMLIPRSKDAIERMFNGRELVDPGLVLVSYWRPEGGDPGPNADRAWVYGGVAAV
ncbi:MAG: SAM-dependent methyltransferase [Streptosporangiaceae bacterium]